MEIPVSAPESGVVREVLFKEGDTVSDGTVVARMDV
jgi:acetyl-CoA carboxylase biotin carboxyl carrier protein